MAYVSTFTKQEYRSIIVDTAIANEYFTLLVCDFVIYISKYDHITTYKENYSFLTVHY